MTAISDIKMVGFDLETTGADKETARIVTLSITNPETHYLISPDVEIEEGASKVHGITNEIARNEGVPIADVLDSALDTLANIINSDTSVITGYNLVFDFTVLEYEANRNNIKPLSKRVEYPFPVFDGFVLDKAVNTFRKGKRTLETLAELYGIKIEAHNSLSDAQASVEVFKAVMDSAKDNSDPRISGTDFHSLDHITLSQWIRSWRDKQDRSIWNYFVYTLGKNDFTIESGFPIEDKALGLTPQDYSSF